MTDELWESVVVLGIAAIQIILFIYLSIRLVKGLVVMFRGELTIKSETGEVKTIQEWESAEPAINEGGVEKRQYSKLSTWTHATLFWAFLAAPIVQMFTTFYVSGDYYYYAKPISIVFAVMLIVFFAYKNFFNKSQAKPPTVKLATKQWAMKIFSVTLMPFVFYFWSYSFVGKEIGLIFHYMSAPVVQEREWKIEGKITVHRRTCRKGVNIELGYGDVTDEVCNIVGRFRDELKPNDLLITSGTESWFGYHVDKVQGAKIF